MNKRMKFIFLYAIKFIIGLVFVSPLIIGILYSFKPESEIGAVIPSLFTENPTLYGYMWVFNKIPIFKYLLNSLIVCGVAILAQVIFASWTAYAFAFFNFRFKKLLFTLILATMMIPGDVVIITNFTTIQSWNLIDTYLGLVLPSLISGTAIFIMRQYYLTISKELKDAATIDGCSDMNFLYRIAMPMSVPTIISLSFYLFIAIYNQYFWPLLVTNNDSYRTIQIGMAMLISSERLEYSPLLAGATVAILPAVIVFIIGQDYLVKGMTAGAVKG
jgi:sn-glycerol 3-phosphate transport system permease protein